MTRRGHTFGPTLGEYLKHRKIKQKDVYQACAMTANQMSKLIHGRHACSIEDAYAIITYLGVPLEFIMNEEWK